MDTPMVDLNRLCLLIQRMLDAELLPDADGAALLAETDAARRSLEAGNTGTVRRHVEQIVRFTEALVATNALVPANGQLLIQIANGILNPLPNAGNAPC